MVICVDLFSPLHRVDIARGEADKLIPEEVSLSHTRDDRRVRIGAQMPEQGSAYRHIARDADVASSALHWPTTVRVIHQWTSSIVLDGRKGIVNANQMHNALIIAGSVSAITDRLLAIFATGIEEVS